MPFQIGEVYRYSSRDRGEGVPAKIVDGLPNFFYETYGGEDKSSIFFQKGIHTIYHNGILHFIIRVLGKNNIGSVLKGHSLREGL